MPIWVIILQLLNFFVMVLLIVVPIVLIAGAEGARRRKSLLTCGIFGGLLVIVITFLPEDGHFPSGENLILAIHISLVGVLAIIAVVLYYKGRRIGVPLIWVSIGTLFALGFPQLDLVGGRCVLYWIAFILVLVAALGMRSAMRSNKLMD